ncbi:MAG: winged helix-turn-helix transcriptional regulator [Bernardetiaceae bacterium]|nr:winged helix-turn-helix transcriptional regulator [Bernardetiaceae bacterium]
MAHAIDYEKYTAQEQQLAVFAKALGHPARVAILQKLTEFDSCCHGSLASELPIAPSSVTQHLKALKNAGLIQGRIEPPQIKYCINKENWEKAKLHFSAFFKD